MPARVHLAALALIFPLAAGACGEVVTVAAHGGTTLRYVLATPSAPPTGEPPATLILLAGGNGVVALDAAGCAQALKGNSLVRTQRLFQAAGLHTALVDAPSDHLGADGLSGFRIDPRHADDLGLVIADLRRRIGGAVWLVGTSRGAISAANAASRLSGGAAADGVVLTSPVSVGDAHAKKPWVAQSVFDLPLAELRLPLLLLGHAEDACARSPSARLDEIAAASGSPRRQVVVFTGGPGGRGLSDVAACEARSPHGFLGQEDEMVPAIARFLRAAPR
ncbi:MAG: hypothetical protein HYU78_07260 [Rhodocyclales bacterium]|nr:hypothetical protein [Rhodocyclales bacterium]